MNYKKINLEGYQIYAIQTDKFKTCYMEVKFRDDVRRVDMTKRNFLLHLLAYTSKSYPTKREMKIAAEELYNIDFGAHTSRAGYNLYTNFSIDFLDPKYVTEESYLEDIIKFLFDIIQNPNEKNKVFDERSFEIVKENVLAGMDKYKEKPLTFAFTDSKQKVFQGSITGKRLVGTKEEIVSITKENIMEEYDKMMRDAHCEILIIGDINLEKMIELIKKYFYRPSIVEEEIPFTIENERKKYQEFEVKSLYAQTQLLVYYDLKNVTLKESQFVVPIFQSILSSAGMMDKLTKYLRVEHSLCYYCGSSFSSSDNYCVIYTGLNYKNVSDALKYIRASMKEMEEGDFEEEFLEMQKEKILSDLALREDNMVGLIDNYYFHEVNGRAMYREFKEEIPKITKEDLKVLAGKMKERCCYVLKEGSAE